MSFGGVTQLAQIEKIPMRNMMQTDLHSEVLVEWCQRDVLVPVFCELLLENDSPLLLLSVAMPADSRCSKKTALSLCLHRGEQF